MKDHDLNVLWFLIDFHHKNLLDIIVLILMNRHQQYLVFQLIVRLMILLVEYDFQVYEYVQVQVDIMLYELNEVMPMNYLK